MSKSKKVIGIDLGTGFSCVSVIEGGQPKVIVNSDGKDTTPSVVTFTKDGEIKVGDSAKRTAVMEPTRTISFIKRFMGQTWDNVQDEVKRAQYKVVKGSNGMPRVDIDGKLYSPEEISAIILQKMKKTAEDYLGEEVEDCVITCPAYYGDDARNAVKNAAKIAELNPLRIINEPTAASLAYGINSDKDQKILVADIGCGTSDFTIIELSSGVYEVSATNGDLFLGGDDFDQCIIDWLLDEFKKDNGMDLSGDSMAMQRLKESAENAKIELSSSTTAEINLPYISSVNNVPVHLIRTLTRAQFEKMTDKLITRIIDVCETCIKKSKYSVKDIDEIVLVGGTTRIPALQNALEKYFGKKVNKSANPDTAISCGAAIQGAILNGDQSVGDLLLLDVTPLSLGIETLGGVMTKIVDANTTIPVSKSKIFSTAEDNQTSVEIRVLQGERPMANDNKQLGIFVLSDIVPAPKGSPKILVQFDIDSNGILNVSAKDEITGNKQNIKIESNSGLSDADIEKMKKDAEENAEKDKQKIEEVQILNMAESKIFECDKQLKNFKDKLTDEQVQLIENDLNALKDAYEHKDISAIKDSIKILDDEWKKIGEKIYSQQDNSSKS